MNRTERSSNAKNGKSRRAERPDPFRFGWRYVWQIAANGSEESVRIPLTCDDLLHPRRNDVTPQNSKHNRDCHYLSQILNWRLAGNPHALVLSDCLVDWGVRGVGNPSPDISVFDNVREPNRDRWIVDVRKEKACPVLVIEVVSPDAHEAQARDNDVVTKVREYYRARVPLYALVDQEREDGPRQIVGYRRGTRKYVPMPLDEQGRLLLEPVRLLMGLRDERVVCWDADSGEEIPDFTTIARSHQAAEAALAAAQVCIRELEARARNGGQGSTQ